MSTEAAQVPYSTLQPRTACMQMPGALPTKTHSTNDNELRRTSDYYPLRFGQKTAFKQPLVSG